MRRYKFRLEAVLRHRETIEGLREQDFAFANGQLDLILTRLTGLQEEHRRTLQARPGSIPGERFDAAGIFTRERYLETLQVQITFQEQQAEAARVVAEAMRRALVEARQARQAVERMREKDLAEYTLECRRLEQDTLDELATLRHARAAGQASEGKPSSSSLPATPMPRKEAA